VTLQPAHRPLRAGAREHAYRLFARLYREGLSPGAREEVEGIPALAEALPAELSREAAAAEHHALFGLQVFPYGGVFLDFHGRVAGASADPVRSAIAWVGEPADLSGEAPDHVSRVLELLASLSARRDGGEEAGQGASAEAAEEATARVRGLLDGHLLWWLPAFVLAVQEETLPFWSVVAELTLDAVVDHRSELPGVVPARGPLPKPMVPAVGDEGPDLAGVARYLAAPARCGIYLSAATIRELGRARRLPSGFGSRLRLLKNLLASAIEYDGLGNLLRTLRAKIWTAEATYRDVAKRHPPVEAVSAAWAERLEATDRLLSAVRDAV